MHILACFILSLKSHIFIAVVVFSFWLSVCHPDWVISIVLSSRSLILLNY